MSAPILKAHGKPSLLIEASVSPTGGPSGPVVQLHGVRMRFGDVEALAGVDLQVQSGEVVAVLGPNGAGKTTLISLMLGLRSPTEGQVRIFGAPAGQREARERIGAMLQESGLPGTLTIRELVELFGAYYPITRPTDVILADANLSDLASRTVGRLSGGQRQRLYFALAIAGDPDLLFLDEPTAGMDVAARHAFWEVVRALAGTGKTIVFTTHLLDEVEALATRVVVVDRGRVVADGTPDQIKARTIGKQIRVRGTLDPAPLAAIDGVRTAVREGDVMVVRAIDAMPVLRHLVALGPVVEDITVEDGGLEAALLALTGAATAGAATAGAAATGMDR